MASFTCTLRHHFTAQPISSCKPPCAKKLSSQFVPPTKRPVAAKHSLKLRHTTRRAKVTCFFKFGNKDAEGAGIYGSQGRDDFDRDDVEQYFNYMGMLAVEGTYDKMEALLNQDIHPVDILLMLAASEGDKPKIEELLRAGAKFDVKDVDGRTALDRANDEIREFIVGFTAWT